MEPGSVSYGPPLWAIRGAEQAAAGQRTRDAGRRRQAERRAVERAYREIGEGLRLERVAVPADRLDRGDRAGRAVPSAPPSAPGCAARRRSPASAAPATGNAPRCGRPRRPSSRSASPRRRRAERSAWRSPRNRRDRAISAACWSKNGWARKAPSRAASTRPCCASAPPRSTGWPVWRSAQSSIRRIAGPGVEGEHVRPRSRPSQVTLATPPILRMASGFSMAAASAGMEQRHERRALAAGGDVGRAKIADDIDAGQPRQQRAVADLPGAALLGAVQDGMAVKADDVDLEAVLGDELQHRRGMRLGDRALDLGDRPGAAEDAAQPLAERRGIGHGQRRPCRRRRPARRSRDKRRRCRRARCRS